MPKPTVDVNVIRTEYRQAAEESGRKITDGDGKDKGSDTKNDCLWFNAWYHLFQSGLMQHVQLLL